MMLAAYLMLLPAAVWLLGALFALIDQRDRGATLIRVAWRGLPFVGAALLLGEHAGVPIGAALVTVLTAHVGWCAVTRLLVPRSGSRDAVDG